MTKVTDLPEMVLWFVVMGNHYGPGPSANHYFEIHFGERLLVRSTPIYPSQEEARDAALTERARRWDAYRRVLDLMMQTFGDDPDDLVTAISVLEAMVEDRAKT